MKLNSASANTDSSDRFYLGENGEMSCLPLAQLMVGGGTLRTSQGSKASSPSITETFTGCVKSPAPPELDLGRTSQADTSVITSQLLNCKMY